MRFGIAGNLQKQGLPQLVNALVRRFVDEGVDYVIERGLAVHLQGRKKLGRLRGGKLVSARNLARSCDLLISLGGDGTILRMARLAAPVGTPILCINLGKLGFLAEVSLEDVNECLTEILKGEYLVVERMMLQAVTSASAKTYLALNDIVMDKYGTSRVLNFETYVDREYLATFTADGVIFSTPTGSTAYALASGGPIVTPRNRSITISPICPHTLTARPVIVPDDSVLRIKIASAPHKVHITADGQDEALLNAPTEIRVMKAPSVARLVKRRNSSYYDLLRKKLRWGTDVRNPGRR
jgi:NAD+ kinase